MIPKGQVSKFTCTSTVTSSRILVKTVLEKSWSEKFHKIFTQKKLLRSPFSSYLTTRNFTEKEVIFQCFLKRFFRILFYVRKLVKQQKDKEAFVRICLTKKLIWRISQNSSRRNFDGVLFSLSSSLQLFLKRTPSQLFSYVTEAIRVCLKCILKIFKISIN